MEERGRDWFVGVDWASRTHPVFVIYAQGRRMGERGFTHGGVIQRKNSNSYPAMWSTKSEGAGCAVGSVHGAGGDLESRAAGGAPHIE